MATRLSASILTILSAPLLLGASTFFQEKERGWHWYEEPLKKHSKQVVKSFSPLSATQEMKQVKKTVQTALDKAILSPTQINVERYLYLQNRITNQSSLFANIWERVLLNTPTLNYQHQFPTNSLGRQLYKQSQSIAQKKSIDKLSRETGLFFFFSSSCPYCQRFAPILKTFAESNQFKLIPITLDGGRLPEFPDVKHDQGQAAKFNVTVTPAVYIVHPKSAKAYPVSIGLVSLEELTLSLHKINDAWENESAP